MTYYVEVFRPAYPNKGIKYRVMKEQHYDQDCLSPCMTALFRCENVTTKDEAVALVIEKAAGKNVSCFHVF